MTALEKLALGTAQFGLEYGITNSRGRVPFEEIEEILDLCRREGIDTIDTASAYGDSEQLLGFYMAKGGGGFKIITKYSVDGGASPAEAISGSLAKLRLANIYGFLIHNLDSFKRNPAIWDEILKQKMSGATVKVGFSLYDPTDVDFLLERGVNFDLVQIPYSILDQRFASTFQKLLEHGVEIHVRSIFLQGLLLLQPDALRDPFTRLGEKIKALRDLAKRLAVPVNYLCIAFAASDEHISRVVIGVDGFTSWAKNVQVMKEYEGIDLEIDKLLELREDDQDLIIPTRWKKT